MGGRSEVRSEPVGVGGDGSVHRGQFYLYGAGGSTHGGGFCVCGVCDLWDSRHLHVGCAVFWKRTEVGGGSGYCGDLVLSD